MSSINVNLLGEGPEELPRTLLFVDRQQGLNLESGDRAELGLLDAQTLREPGQTLPIEFSKRDEIYDCPQWVRQQCDLRSQRPTLDELEEMRWMEGKRVEREATEHGVLEA